MHGALERSSNLHEAVLVGKVQILARHLVERARGGLGLVHWCQKGEPSAQGLSSWRKEVEAYTH